MKLRAFDLGDQPPKSWRQGDVDVTFTPFAKAARAVFSTDVEAVRGAENQTINMVYTSKVTNTNLQKLAQKLKALDIPGRPRFVQCEMVESGPRKGLLVLKYKIY